MKYQSSFSFLISFFLLFHIVSCKTVSISEMSQEDGINKIRENFKNQSWSETTSSVDEYKVRYPYSKFNPEAEFIQANAYYLSGKYPEAIIAYEDFARKNPIDSNVSIAYYRIAKSYDLQSPEETDRDQTSTRKAIERYQYFIKNYSKSEYASESAERVSVLTYRLAGNEAFIARFYWNKDYYSAALGRYLEIITKYSQFPELRKEAIERSIICYKKLADFLEDDPTTDKYSIFRNITPNELRKKAEDLKELL